MSDHVAKATEYELFVKDVYQRLYAVEGIENPVIRHNVTLIGKSGAPHQIDVYWEFALAGIRHCVAVECKNYSSSVKKEKIAAFKGVLDDLPGNVKGIYASRAGYQEGALTYAKAFGIEPMIIRKPLAEDWNGYIKNIVMELHILVTKNTRVSLEGDTDWLLENVPEIAKYKSGFLQTIALNSETYIEDLDKQETRSILDYQNDLPREKAGKDFSVEYDYANAYMIFQKLRYKIRKFRMDYDVQEYTQTIEIKGDDLITAIVMNCLGQGAKLIDRNGKVREREVNKYLPIHKEV